MTIQTLTLSQIQASALNPRKFFNDTGIAELAQSIKTDGLLQNLVVTKPKGKTKKYNIIAGERRFRALTLLINSGALPQDFPVSVEIRENLTDDEALRIATVENVQRENLSPLEEAEALNTLVQTGGKLDDIVAQTGLSVATIRRRLLLLGLSEKTKEALSRKAITLSQAEALTIGQHEEQDDILDDLLDGRDMNAEDIKERLVGDLPTLAMAIFPKDQYTGDFTTDLLAEDDATYFNDVEQFYTLQKAAAEKLVQDYAQSHEWAVLEEGYSFHKWEYSEAAEGEKGGVVVFFSRSGDVSIYEGLAKGRADRSTTAALSVKAKDFYPSPLRRYIGMHKSLAVQAALLGNPRKSKELVVSNKLVSLKAHHCLPYFEQEDATPPALVLIDQKAQILLSYFGVEAQKDETARETFCRMFSHDSEAAYIAVQALSDTQLEEIALFLEVCTFGQGWIDRLDTQEDSLFNMVATSLAVDMRDYWRPDEGFLKRRNKVQLQQIINEAGAAAKLGSAATYKKGELVKALVKFFSGAKKAKSPSDNDLKANDWLPEAMAFPAIDPDRKDVEAYDNFEDDMMNADEETSEQDDEDF
ncbi:MAG: ParB/RepB/Spo0J family partition protein [Alphaproteobacteria bacterium]|nr:ParB/RepB/Spo0J family partition protein [Alphaproteobacteria bacterium]